MLKLKNVLVPTDFSSNSVAAMEFACFLAQNKNITLHILYVIESARVNFKVSKIQGKEKFEQSKLLAAEEEMRRFISKISIKDINFLEVIKIGSADEQILKYANESSIDMIIIASHGWTGLSHLITGNVVNKVMRRSEIPIVCIKSNHLAIQEGKGSFKSTFAENWFG